MKEILDFFAGHLKRVDKILPIICIAITAFDIFLVNMMYQTGYIKKTALITQIAAAIIGVAASFVISLFDYKFIAKVWYIYAPVAVILQLLVWSPIGVQRDDDVAWIQIGGKNGVTIQPSEILKFVFIITLALHISKLGDKLNSIPHLLLLCAHGLFPTALIIVQGDAGSALVFLFIFIVMLFMGGISWKYIAVAIAAVPPVVYVAWNYIMKDHHRMRFLLLFDEELQQKEILNTYYQQYQGKIGLGMGQLTGIGFDFQAENHIDIPEIYNDFVFSFIGMTMGFIGCMAVVIALAALCLKLLSNASGASDPLGKLICSGVFALVLFHCIINIGMVLSVVPVIGIPLPFISTGGTSMIMMHAYMGLVLSVSAHKEKAKHMFYEE
ncbi:MAG: FtsW/RodA/SpoVE family cell cycle protein [Lachnospiraceae bacterium]|nr:FtsW/RodA/SpoVE family cell cycle protein [Ruminococcus sp.]MCM1274181.1 FtsW/RodA/SpoVE family cell cycle protein [Lachnospiraceae bacterium]